MITAGSGLGAADTPAQQRARREVLARATEWTWEPCAGSGQPLAEQVRTKDGRGRETVAGWCSVCDDFVGGRWDREKSRPVVGSVATARKHKDKRQGVSS